MTQTPRSMKPIALAIGVAIVAVVAFLYRHETPVPAPAPASSASAAATGARFTMADRLQSIVGTVDKGQGSVRSADKAGVLVFGPYAPLAAGKYSVTWMGQAHGPSKPRFEVTSMKSGLLAGADPVLQAGAAEALQTLEFTVAQPITDAEFRVLVSGGDALTVTSVELKQLAGTP